MRVRGLLAGVGLALLAAPAAVAARPVTVAYDSPSALRGLHVLTRVAPLHIAKVSTADVRALRARPGIRWVNATVARRHLGVRLAAAPRSAASAEWEFAATRSDLVPGSVLRAAANVTIAVVDTGADLAAPGIAAKDPTTYNAVTGSSTITDVTGHGTFVTSVAGGAATGSGVVGFGGDAKLLIVQANRDANVFDDVDEAAGIVWAVDHGAKIVNLSIGGASTSRAEKTAIGYAISHGALVVAAAGNTGQGGNVPSYPAALLGPHGLAVAASTAQGTRAPFSTAAPYVSLAAPGVHVLGATTADASRAEYPRAALESVRGLYAYGTGTSYSAPQVAGAAALVWAADPSLTRDEVVEIVEHSAAGNGTWNSGTGWGVLDVASAVARALGIAPPKRQ
jgi:subtilisin family serine protease